MDRVIKNFDALATTPLRRDGLEILEAGYEAILTPKVLAENVRREGDILFIKDESVNLADFDRVFFVAVGKCAVASATTLEPLILDKLTAGIALDVVPGTFQKIKSLVGTHPLVSEQNVTATKEIVAMLSGLTDKDLVILAISGGGSALLTMPSGLNLDQVKELTELAFSKGTTIEDLNIVRRHLSVVKGGGLVKIMHPAHVVSLIFSDVPRNNLADVASGPTVFDKTNVSDAQAVIAKYGVFDVLSWPGFELLETPKDE
ncbi:MAG: glycerate-2-kinase family protein, partial [Candidatus Vogelbacteria bacterium]|nr:glycerate-2-kinase family protein [Candidatus Vogelbacteria bacterium]